MVGEVSERLAMTRTRAVPQDLKARAISGIVLAVIALAASYAGPPFFSALAMTVAALMAWEWGRIVRGTSVDFPLAVHAGAIVVAGLTAAMSAPGLGLLAVAAGAAIVLIVTKQGSKWLSGLGVLYVGVPMVALIWFRRDESYGFLAVLYLMIVVGTTDTFAYLCGTLIGGPKLWPRVSPNKTWAGLIGGIVFAGIAGGLFALCTMNAQPAELAVTGLVLSAVSQAGDLAESALKRAFDVKHASALIPGHGGFMDRMDGVVAAATVAGLGALAVQSQSPARALLFWY